MGNKEQLCKKIDNFAGRCPARYDFANMNAHLAK